VGRGAPEIDIFETQSKHQVELPCHVQISHPWFIVDVSVFRGEVSQSLQAAPFNYKYEFTSNTTPATTIYDESVTKLNLYKGGPYQQAISAVAYIDNQNYDGMGYQTYGFEWWSDSDNRDEGYVTWFSGGEKTWTATSATIGPDPVTKIGSRLISEEPHVGTYLLDSLR
jgi:beta-glucan synthesis-associated protein KRE6